MDKFVISDISKDSWESLERLTGINERILMHLNPEKIRNLLKGGTEAMEVKNIKRDNGKLYTAKFNLALKRNPADGKLYFELSPRMLMKKSERDMMIRQGKKSIVDAMDERMKKQRIEFRKRYNLKPSEMKRLLEGYCLRKNIIDKKGREAAIILKIKDPETMQMEKMLARNVPTSFELNGKTISIPQDCVRELQKGNAVSMEVDGRSICVSADPGSSNGIHATAGTINQYMLERQQWSTSSLDAAIKYDMVNKDYVGIWQTTENNMDKWEDYKQDAGYRNMQHEEQHQSQGISR